MEKVLIISLNIKIELNSLRSSRHAGEYWNNGPPWRDISVKRICDCNISEIKVILLRAHNSGLGQGLWENGIMGEFVLDKLKDWQDSS